MDIKNLIEDPGKKKEELSEKEVKCPICGRDTIPSRSVCKWCDAASGLYERSC